MLNRVLRLGLGSALALSLSMGVDANDLRTPVYRFWHPSERAHFYTSDENEKNRLLAAGEWQFEGARWLSADARAEREAQPVYRFWRGWPPRHFYTTDPAEREALRARPEEWRDEGIAWYAHGTWQPGTFPVYRFWNPAWQTHVYVSDENERQALLAMPSWQAQGVAWYAYPVADDVPIDVVRIVGGCFALAGASQNPSVCIGDFAMGRYEVTQAQWQAVMGSNPAWWSDCPTCPVEQVTWREAQEFIAALNRRTGRHYRLPTEAEWEYVCHGGNPQLIRLCGEGEAPAWLRATSVGRTRPVGQGQPNRWGLYDLSDNVAEWTCSLYVPIHDGSERTCAEQLNRGYRVARGGSWADEPNVDEQPLRRAYPLTTRRSTLGLRLAHD